MKIRIIILAILASTLFFTANAAPVTATDHAFDPNASDTNKYNLDMSQDGISPGSFLYCRWGTLCDQADNVGLWQPIGLEFDYLTPPPYSSSSRDLLILNNGALDQFQLTAFQNQWPLPDSSSSWTTPLGPSYLAPVIGDPIVIQPGNVEFTTDFDFSSYFLFRKHQFTPVLFEFHGPRLDPNASKLIIMIHGWNPAQNYDSYQQDADLNNLAQQSKARQAGLTGKSWATIGRLCGYRPKSPWNCPV